MKLFIGLCVAFFILLVVADKSEPEPVDWTPSYEVAGKNPFDLYVFNGEINRIFEKGTIRRFGKTPYEYLNEHRTDAYDLPGFTISGTMLSIGQRVDKGSISELLLFAAHGNTVFISDYAMQEALADSLGFTIKTDDYVSERQTWAGVGKSKRKIAKFDRLAGRNYFSTYDKTQTEVLGYARNDDGKPHPNFVRIRYRNGYFFLHLDPEAFTNFYLLKNADAGYVENVLTLMPHERVYFFTNDARDDVNGSLLRFLYRNVALRWAWWLLLGGILVFIIFNAKRRQRIIPIITPLTNTTVEFVQTIANLYRQEGDHGTLAEKKVVYFLERVRQEFLVDTTKLDDAFIKRLHLKSGKPEEDIRRVCDLINNFKRNRFSINEEELIAFNEATEKIFS